VVDADRMNALLASTAVEMVREEVLENAALAAAGPEVEHTWRALDLIDLGSESPRRPRSEVSSIAASGT
jgi:hypothetical protein